MSARRRQPRKETPTTRARNFAQAQLRDARETAAALVENLASEIDRLNRRAA